MKFSVFRNPFDFAVCNYSGFRQSGRSNLSFREFLLGDPRPLTVRTEISEIYGKSSVHFTLCDERFHDDQHDDLAEISAKLGVDPEIWSRFTDVKAKGNLRAQSALAREAFDGFYEGIESVRRTCRSTFERYDYDFDPL